MMNQALIVTDGLHNPWNKGEAVLARNFTSILMRLYEKAVVLSTIDKTRGEPDLSEKSCRGTSGVIFYTNERDIKRRVKNESGRKRCDIHILHSLNTDYMCLALRKHVFFYQFSYGAFGNPSIKAYAVPALATFGVVTALTTSLKTHKLLNRLFRRSYYYTPAPLFIPSNVHRTGYMAGEKNLKVLYIGHPAYERFPYMEIFRALKKLRDEEYEIDFEIYFSRIRGPYFDYIPFTRAVILVIKKLDIADIVKLHVINLAEEKKYKVLADSDVLLYPALCGVAVDPPVIILEAMAMGCCVVSTPMQSIPFIFNHDRGILLSGQDITTEIYETLSMLASNPHLLERYGAAAKRYIELSHNPEVILKHVERIITKDPACVAS